MSNIDESVLHEKYRPLVDAAEFLVRLKDGPRDTFYEMSKEIAWQKLRDALAALEK